MQEIPTDVLDYLLEDENELDKINKDYNSISFNNYFKTLLNKYGYSKNYVIRETCVDERYARRLFQGKYKISFDLVVSIGIIIGADIKEINKMLILSENTPMYSQRKRDQVIIHCIKNHKSLIETNTFLFDRGYTILLSKNKNK